jgi:hypothetical protein
LWIWQASCTSYVKCTVHFLLFIFSHICSQSVSIHWNVNTTGVEISACFLHGFPAPRVTTAFISSEALGDPLWSSPGSAPSHQVRRLCGQEDVPSEPTLHLWMALLKTHTLLLPTQIAPCPSRGLVNHFLGSITLSLQPRVGTELRQVACSLHVVAHSPSWSGMKQGVGLGDIGRGMCHRLGSTPGAHKS